ncbi:MAG: hypothetical protein QOJ33_1236 [Chloroflexota bacterium]|jgi:Glycosyltransferase family 87|nr:hypothetical protein [Chloroflexota bacterium]
MRKIIIALCALAALWVGAPAQAKTQAPKSPLVDVAIPMFPAAGPSVKPPGFEVTAGQAVQAAKTSPKMQAIHRLHHPLQFRVFVLIRSHYEVYFFFHGKIIGDVLVWRDGRRGPTYTGPLTVAFYGRGHYGDIFDSPFVFLPFGLLFLLPLARLRRSSGTTWLDRLDLGMLLSFGVSYAVFDAKHLEAGVWLAYPPLLYLLIRLLRRGWRGRSGNGRLECRLPIGLLAVGLLALTAARIGLTLAPSHVMDVGGASAIGAYRILHGQSIYFASLGHPDTYGPIAYLAYLPFQLIWHDASWYSYLPSVRATTIAFDLVTIGGLVLLGARLRPGREGRRLGLVLGWLWAACPFSLLGMVKGTNDGLVAMFVVLLMLSLSSPMRRGVVLGLAAAAKFFPAILLPLLAARGPDGSLRESRKALAGFVIAAGASVALFLPSGGLKEVYDHTIGYQLTRSDVFSPWALHPGLAPLKLAIELGVIVLALTLAVRPRGARTPAQVSALAGALIIGVQLPALHWFYLYIVWFLPLVLIAVLGEGDPVPESLVIDVEPLELPGTVPATDSVVATA